MVTNDDYFNVQYNVDFAGLIVLIVFHANINHLKNYSKAGVKHGWNYYFGLSYVRIRVPDISHHNVVYSC